MATPYMGLTLPTVSVTAGPLYATENNSAFTTIDSHNHTSGKGAQVPTLGLNINADLSFASYNATTLRSTRYNNQGSPLGTASDLRCLYFSGGELYANDSSGNQVQITSGGSVNVAGSGNITGMGATTATVAYTSGNQTFTFSSNTNVKAFLSTASLSIATTTASADAVTLASGVLTGGAYTLTLPVAVASTNNALLMSSNAGVLSYLALGAANKLPRVNSGGTALEYSLVQSANIDTLSALTVTNLTVSTSIVLNSATLTGSGGTLTSTGDIQPNSASAARLTYSTDSRTLRVSDSAGSKIFPIVVSADPTSHVGLMIVRGQVSAVGAKDNGEGFTSAKTGAGAYTITFTTAFADTPVFVGNPFSSGFNVNITSLTTAAASYVTTDTAGTPTDNASNFICMGTRGT